MTTSTIPTPEELKARIYNENEEYSSFLKFFANVMSNDEQMRNWLVLRDGKISYTMDVTAKLSDFNRLMVSEHLKPLGWEIEFSNISGLMPDIYNEVFNRIRLKPLGPIFRNITPTHMG